MVFHDWCKKLHYTFDVFQETVNHEHLLCSKYGFYFGVGEEVLLLVFYSLLIGMGEVIIFIILY